ncbi:MAG TPA: DUF3631 domain-containing protein [Thermoanaerobaculia bacterium]
MTLQLRDVLRGASLNLVTGGSGEAETRTAVPSGTKAEQDALLSRLRAAQSLDDEQTILRDLGSMARQLDDLGRVYVREQTIAILAAHGRSSPARIADAALGHSTAETTTVSTDLVRVVEPWHGPVDGARLLDDLASTITRHVVLPAGAADALALWIVHTYVFERHIITPRLLICSPEKRCGKSTLLGLLGETCNRPLVAGNLTAAVMYRVIEAAHPTLLIDEADTFVAEADDLRGIINAGHRHGGVVLRCVGDDSEPRAFACFGPVAMAAIGRVPDTITDRSVIVSMRRRGRTEHVERFRLDRVAPLRDLARQCARWAADHGNTLDLDPATPEALHDRGADNWRVLLSIADRAGRHWPGQARAAALRLSDDRDDDESTRVHLLGDIREVMDARGLDRIATTDLLADLHAMESRSWGDWSHGRAMTPQALGKQLKPFRITAAKWREGTLTVRGYDRADFGDSWGRYL